MACSEDSLFPRQLSTQSIVEYPVPAARRSDIIVNPLAWPKFRLFVFHRILVQNQAHKLDDTIKASVVGSSHLVQ